MAAVELVHDIEAELARHDEQVAANEANFEKAQLALEHATERLAVITEPEIEAALAEIRRCRAALGDLGEPGDPNTLSATQFAHLLGHDEGEHEAKKAALWAANDRLTRARAADSEAQHEKTRANNAISWCKGERRRLAEQRPILEQRLETARVAQERRRGPNAALWAIKESLGFGGGSAA